MLILLLGKELENAGGAMCLAGGFSVFKVFNSAVNATQDLNIYPLITDNDKHLFYQIEADFTDSIQVRFLTDSLKAESETSTEFLSNGQEEIEGKIWSEIIPLYRPEILTWDYINKVNKSSTFSHFYDLGEVEEEDFIKLTDDEIDELIKHSKEERGF